MSLFTNRFDTRFPVLQLRCVGGPPTVSMTNFLEKTLVNLAPYLCAERQPKNRGPRSPQKLNESNLKMIFLQGTHIHIPKPWVKGMEVDVQGRNQGDTAPKMNEWNLKS